MQPRAHFRLRDAHFLRNAKLRQIGFGVDPLRLKKLHLLVDFLMGNLRRFRERVNEIVKLTVNALDDALVFVGLAAVKFLVKLGDNGLCNGGGTGRREDVF